MYIDAERIPHQNQLVVWYRDADDKLNYEIREIEHYCYVESPVDEYRSMFGHKLARVDFDSYFEFREYVNQKERLFESDINPVYKFLSDEFYNTEGGELHIGLFDIEVNFDLSEDTGYPTPENPFGEINSISLFDRFNQEYHLFLLNADHVIVESPDGLPVKHHYCHSEHTLLSSFFGIINPIDVLSAWHGGGFDIPYLVARISKIWSPKATESLCRNRFRPIAREHTDDYGNASTRYILVGRPHMDALDMYKKFTFEEKTSYKLDSIAELELGEKKVEYAGNLGELYRNNPQKFYEYSLHDTYLLKKLDEKLQHIDLAVAMARQAAVRFNDVFGSIRYLEMTIWNYCRHEKDPMVILPDKDPYAVREQFAGAHVVDTMTGVFGWCMSIDLTSLYPSIMMALGISPECMIMQCNARHKDFVRIVEQQDVPIGVQVRDIMTRRNETHTIKAKELHDIIRESGYTLSANGTVFSSEEGIIPEILRVWFSKRQQLKASMKECDKNNDVEGSKFYDMRQHIQKINLNSLYGALSNPWCRFFDVDLARSITMTGQEIGKYQAYYANQLIENDEGKNTS